MKQLIILTLFILVGITFGQNEYGEKWARQDSGTAYVNVFEMSPRFYLGAFRIPTTLNTVYSADTLTFKVGFHADSLTWLVDTDSTKYVMRVKLDSWVPVPPIKFFPFKYVQIFHSDSTVRATKYWKFIERRY